MKIKKKKSKPLAKVIRKEVEIVASYSGKIETGKFSNENPFFSLKEVWSGDINQDFIDTRQKTLSQMCYDKFSECEQRSFIDKIQESRKDIRFYPIGKEIYPSVTSIINWDSDFEENTKHIPKNQMREYAARGTIIHIQISHFLKTKEWKEAKDIPETYPYRLIIKKGELGLSFDGYDFRGFFEKYPFEIIQTDGKVINNEHKYAGTYDIKCKMNNIITLCDVKTGSNIDKVNAFQQLTAYAKCIGNEDVKQIVIIPLNNTTKQGFSQPAIEPDMEKYFPLFLENRKMFRERFGI